jgi:hypothetical protein
MIGQINFEEQELKQFIKTIKEQLNPSEKEYEE